MLKNPNNPIKYFIYVRKSSEDKEKQVASIGDQLEVLKKIATHNKLQIVGIYEEPHSCFTAKRNQTLEWLPYSCCWSNKKRKPQQEEWPAPERFP